MTELDDDHHGIHLTYTDTAMTIEMCEHVDKERALVLLAVAINAIAAKFDLPKQFVVEGARRMSDDPLLISRSMRIF